MATTVRVLVTEGQAAAARLREALDRLNAADTDKEADQASKEVEESQRALDHVNSQLYAKTAESIDERGHLVAGWGRELVATGAVRASESDEAHERQEQGGVAATIDKSEEQIHADHLAAAQQQEAEFVAEVVRKHTGKDVQEVDAQIVQRAIREEALVQGGITKLLDDRPIVGASRLDETDEEVRGGIDEAAQRELIGSFVGKAGRDVTIADIAQFRKVQEDAAIEAATGRAVADLTPLERMQAASAVREAALDQARLRENANAAADSTAADEADAPSGVGARVGDAAEAGAGAIRVGAIDAEPGRDTGGTAQGGGSSPPGEPSPRSGDSGTHAPADAEPLQMEVITVLSDGERAIPGSQGTRTDQFYRDSEGNWYDGAGNPLNADDEAMYEEIYQDEKGSPLPLFQPAGPPPPGAAADSGAGATGDAGGGRDGESAASGTAGADGSSDGDDTDDTSDNATDDDSDGDSDGEDGAAQDDQAPAGDTAGGDGAGADGSTGSAGTLLPDQVGEDPAGRAAFEDSPLGAEQKGQQEDHLAEQRGGGVTDPPGGDDGSSGGTGGGLRFVGGAVDPADFEFGTGAGGPLDEVALAGGGVVDPPQDDPAPTPAGAGGTLLGGGLGPVVPGGLRPSGLGSGAVTSEAATTSQVDDDAEVGGATASGATGGGAPTGGATVGHSQLVDTSLHTTGLESALSAGQVSPQLQIQTQQVEDDLDDLGD